VKVLAAVLMAMGLSGCVGLPVGHRSFVVVGVGLVRIDRANQAVGVSSRSVGLTIGCRQLTLGFLASYCAHIPLSGDVAIIERSAGPNQHLSLIPLHPMEQTR
jgi:hypothetical protein